VFVLPFTVVVFGVVVVVVVLVGEAAHADGTDTRASVPRRVARRGRVLAAALTWMVGVRTSAGHTCGEPILPSFPDRGVGRVSGV
jgi:hypothetical protein